jgi:small subunit ribosomal protein S20
MRPDWNIRPSADTLSSPNTDRQTLKARYKDRSTQDMPNTTSAKKALRQNLKRRALNRSQRSALRTTLKKFRAAAAGENSQEAESMYRVAVKRLDQAAAKGLIHKNTAARTKSRLSKLLPKAPAGNVE